MNIPVDGNDSRPSHKPWFFSVCNPTILGARHDFGAVKKAVEGRRTIRLETYRIAMSRKTTCDRWLTTSEPPIRSDARSAYITELRPKVLQAVAFIPPPSRTLNIPSC